ncbi:TetR/AcrR family transcriptional regulator [Actinobacteria bacterium YIM 96077]|uniref:TetR/AcrR family transcriptional regulator n=1 Tax=Phytoactinopolyspora halophila TaxID=1981511 RepID=A0A329R1N6_9ACTN|nr:TetR/AcrR family transcriptional regulator [Phytoactinopolyspora halophila]AYY12242.1 TetR/AcrR family transcriptional regulator [Actinobacteria bacterium YIM 96077]RAW18525.1 TetR/AcrR family transcriptional regulator [Phytoactinopolyspora halophila]
MRPENSPGGRKPPSFIEQARRAQIIEAAAETVAAVGYANASLAQIAEHAGISKSVISYHFAGKNELLERLVHEFFEDAGAYMERHLEAEATARGRIRTWIESQLSFFGSHRTRFLAMAEIVTNHRRPDGSKPFSDLDEEEVAELAKILEIGQANGEVRDLDPRAAAVIIGKSIEGVLSRWAWGSTVDLEAETTALVDFVDHAIAAPEHRPPQ